MALQASRQGLDIIDRARKRRGWTKTSEIWRQTALVGVAALKKFWQRRPIVQENFVAICQAVGVNDWESIVDDTPTQSTTAYMEFSVYDENWVGRETLINDLSNRLKGSCRVLLLVGLAGIGKTALAERLVQDLRGGRAEERENFKDDENQASDFASVVSVWLEKWGENVPPDQRRPEHLRNRLVRYLCDRQHLILMDSLEYILRENEEDGGGDFADPEWGNFFVSLLSQPSCQSRFILTSQDLPILFETAECERYHNLWHKQLLKGLEPSEQEDLFEKASLDEDLKSPSSPLRLIGEVYDGHPLALRVIAGEIKESYGRNVRTYWNENSHYIEEVKKALDEACRNGKVEGAEDRWQLASYTRALQLKVEERVEKTFERLIKDRYDAYFLLCTASVYRCEVPVNWWLTHLEYRDYSEERQKAAMQALRDRYLVEDGGTNHEDERLVGQHNLIRSVAIAHRLQLLPEN